MTEDLQAKIKGSAETPEDDPPLATAIGRLVELALSNAQAPRPRVLSTGKCSTASIKPAAAQFGTIS
jgi:hypothetical protein